VADRVQVRHQVVLLDDTMGRVPVGHLRARPGGYVRVVEALGAGHSHGVLGLSSHLDFAGTGPRRLDGGRYARLSDSAGPLQ
jgi:hypothetical protein